MDYVLDRLPMDQGWAFYAWAIENDGWLQFSGVKRDGDGYVMQGARELVGEAMKQYGR
jgi:hypothetical protein